MLRIHAGQEADDDLGVRFVACFAQAADDAGLPDPHSSAKAFATT
jgi:hemoglobin